MNDSNCPHCKATLDPMPQHKKKCPSCGKDIYVRTDPFKKVKILVNYADALSTDIIANMEIKEKEYRVAEKELTQKFKTSPSRSDILWSIIAKLQMEAMKKEQWQQLNSLYFTQAEFLHKQGKGYSHILKIAMKCQLEHMKSMDITKMEILASLCNKCASINGRKMSVEEALEVIPLPPEDCENIACFMYLPAR